MASKNKQEQIVNNETIAKSEAFIERNKKTLAISIVAILVIIAGFFCYRQFISAPRENKASTALALGQEYFGREMYEVALNGDSTKFVGFNNIIKNYGGTDAGNLAKLYAGLCYANLEKWQEARKLLEDFSPKSDALISPATYAALANVYVELKEYDKAVSNFKKAASLADKRAAEKTNYSISPVFLMQAGKILESQGKNEEALKVYQSIKKKYVLSNIVQSQEVDKYIERIQSK